MKPHCERCQEIIDQVAECAANIDSDDEIKRLASRFGLAMIVSPDYEPIEDGRWTRASVPNA